MKNDQNFSPAGFFLAIAVAVYLLASTLLICFDVPFLRQSNALLTASVVLILVLATLLRHVSLLVRVKQMALDARPVFIQRTQDDPLGRPTVESVLGARLVMDEDGVIVGCSDAFCALTGYPENVLVGADMANFLVSESGQEAFRASMADYLTASLSRESRTPVESAIVPSDGNEIPVELLVDVISENQQSYFSAYITDLRQRSSIEQDLRLAKTQAEAASRAKSRFLATMSHEIRTPLNALLGVVSLMRSNLEKKERENLLSTAKKTGEHLSSVVNSVLDFSKIDAGEMLLDNKPFSVVERVRDAVNLYQPLACGKGLEIRAVCDPQCSKYVLGDASKISQILNNLISNAIKFTDSGEVTVKVERTSLVSTASEYCLSVSDTGVGIAADHFDLIFDAFAQSDGTVSRRHNGAGLGLAISRQLAMLMGGDISLTSRVGVGSVFRARLMLPDSRALPAPKNRDHQDARTYGTLETSRILLVEDSPANQQVVGEALRRAGYAVTVAADGIAAREQLRNGDPFNLVLSDIRMPRMNGLELARWMRQSGITLPIIALTARAFKEDEAACVAAGMDGLLTKPVDFELLECTIAERLNPPPALQRAAADLERALRQDFSTDDEFAYGLSVMKKNLWDLMRRLRSAASQQDFAELDVVVQRLDSIAARYQLRDLREACADLEKASGDRRRALIDTLEANVSSLLDGLAPLQSSSY
jgi:PAS domain S-box-containing protein